MYSMKKTSYLPTPLSDAIHRYAIRGNYKLVGSSSIRGSLYWSDLDVMDTLFGRAETLAHEFQKIAKVKDGSIWRELKAGLDKRFLTEKSILDSPLVSTSEKRKLQRLHGLEKEEYMRTFYILRWTKKETAQGYKNLRGPEKKLLKDAIQDDTILKLDLIIPVGHTFYDVSEMYFYKQTEQKEDDILKELEDDIDYYKSSNTLKALKRLYSVFKLKGQQEPMERLDTFFNSWVGYLNKCISDLEVVDAVPKTYNIQNSLYDIQVRLGNIEQVPHSYISMVFTKRKKLIEYLRKIVNDASKELLHEFNK